MLRETSSKHKVAEQELMRTVKVCNYIGEQAIIKYDIRDFVFLAVNRLRHCLLQCCRKHH